MTIDYDVTKSLNGRLRNTPDSVVSSKNDKTRKKSYNTVKGLLALMSIYVGALLIIYAAGAAGVNIGSSGFSSLFFGNDKNIIDTNTSDNEQAKPVNEAAQELTDEYNLTVEESANAYITKISEKVAEAREAASVDTPVFIANDYALPVSGEITSTFSNRPNPFYTEGSSEDKYEFHTGVDLEAPIGTPVFAYTNGIVTDTSVSNSYGNYIIISHGGYETLYAHLDTMIVSEGDSVSAGTKIAFSGDTGRSTGPHLHFEVRINGTPVNPLKYLY